MVPIGHGVELWHMFAKGGGWLSLLTTFRSQWHAVEIFRIIEILQQLRSSLSFNDRSIEVMRSYANFPSTGTLQEAGGGRLCGLNMSELPGCKYHCCHGLQVWQTTVLQIHTLNYSRRNLDRPTPRKNRQNEKRNAPEDAERALLSSHNSEPSGVVLS